MQRYFTASLANLPDVRTSGSYGHDEVRLEWVQPQEIWQGLLLKHAGIFHLSGYAFEFEPYSLVIIPPGSRCEVAPKGSPEYNYNYFTFRPNGVGESMALPLLTPLGEDGKFWDRSFLKALTRLQLTKTNIQVMVGALLWHIAEPAHAARRNITVEAAEQWIESRLSQEIRIAHLAHDLSVSQSQLCRLFLADHGRTPLQYVRDRKAQHAHLLLTTTALPIKQIASACGFSDLHAFNRFVRDRLGASPRSVRSGRESVDIYRLKEARP
jgi:AraC-like DNA-binding protein